MAEYRATLLHPATLARFAHLTPRRIQMALHRLRYIADEYKIGRVKFEFERDPRDAMFIDWRLSDRRRI